MIRGTRLGLAGLFLLPGALASQALPLPGRTTLFELDPTATPVGEFPSTIKLLTGIMSVELKDGVPMLKASSASQFLITLPRALPDRFTLEFELVPKACCAPHDLSFEGTPAINQGLGSAHVLWDSDGYLGVIGGARDNYEVPMPEELRVTTPGVLTSVVAVVEGTTIVLYTNGRRLYTLTDRHFIRSRSLRVHLGGQDDETRAVYLAHLRVAAGSLPPAVIAGLPTPPAGRPERAAPSAVGGQPPAPPPPPPPPGEVEPTPVPVPPSPTPPRPGRPVDASRCTPGSQQGEPPLGFRLGGGRVGGAVMEWRAEPGAGYLVERSPDPGTARRGWTRLTSTCDASSGIRSTEAMDEDGTTYTAMVLTDIYGGLQLGSAYAYRVTVVRPDGTSGSAEAGYTTSGGAFEIGPTAAVHSGPSGSTVSLAAGISYCSAYTPPLRCDPWMMEFTVTGSSTGFDYSSRQPWTNNYDPSLPATAPGGVDGTFSFTLPAPPGTHTFTLTALYQPDFRVDAGSVTVVVPPLPPTSGSAAGLPGTPSALPSSRVIMLTGVQAVSAFILPASRSVDLGNWSATGSPRAP